MEDSRNVSVALLQFERRLKACGSAPEVAFAAVNEILDILRFEQAVLWRLDVLARPGVKAASGLADVSVESPYIQWLEKLIRSLSPTSAIAPKAYTLADLTEDLATDGEEWCHEHMLLCPLSGPGGILLGGMLLFRSDPFDDAETAASAWIAESVAYSLWAWRKERHQFWRWARKPTVAIVVLALTIVAGALALIPVRLNALAPAEITPQKAIPVTAPVEGVVKEIVVRPNQIVAADAPLVILDDTSIRNRLSVAEKALEFSKAELQRAINKAFSDEASRTDLQVLQARVREKAADVRYLSEVLGRLKITAPQGGIAIFSDAEEWRGRPVQPGERIMVIADPSLVAVTVYLSPDDAVELSAGAEVSVFLNNAPLSSLPARIVRTSYEAMPTSEGTLAYHIQAELLPGHNFPRIGMRGTAKVYSDRVSLAYYIFRKPVAYIRRSLGL